VGRQPEDVLEAVPIESAVGHDPGEQRLPEDVATARAEHRLLVRLHDGGHGLLEHGLRAREGGEEVW
jgi:hypothetical protein